MCVFFGLLCVVGIVTVQFVEVADVLKKHPRGIAVSSILAGISLLFLAADNFLKLTPITHSIWMGTILLVFGVRYLIKGIKAKKKG